MTMRSPPLTFSEPKKAFVAAIYAAVIICITLSTYFVSNNHYQPITIYDQAQLVFVTQDKDEQQQFAIQKDKGQFLFAAGAPKTVGTALSFSSKGDIRVRIKSIYPGKQCSENGIGKATIVFSTPVEQYSKLLDDRQGEVILPVLAKDKVGIHITNTAEANCGRAMIWLSQDTHFVQYILAFPIIWLGVLVLLIRFNLGFLAAWGAGIQASYMVSETYYDQAIQTHMGLSTLIALLAVGLVLIPLFARPLKPVAFALFILASIFILGLPLLNMGNYWAFNSTIDTNSIHAILGASASGLAQFLGGHFSGLKLFLGGLSLLALAVFGIRALRKSHAALAMSGLGASFFALSVIFIPQFSEKIVTLNVWTSGAFSYFRELSAFDKLAEQRKKVPWNYELTRVGAPRVTVLVIGESHNKNHMSLYGYPRPTTPALEKRANNDNLIVLQNVYSNHTNKTPALTQALTRANQYNSAGWIQSPSILELAKQSDIQTYWLTNQPISATWNNQVSLIAREADQVVEMNDNAGSYKQGDKYDEVLLDPLQKSIQTPGEKLIVLHLMGNHDKYCMRYPENWEIFSQKLETQRFGQLSQTANTNINTINCYDNGIAYNDYILDSIFSLLEKSAISASVFYFADHSEDVFGGKAHSQEDFDFTMTEIPSLIWATEQWKQENLPLWDQLILNREEVFTSDLVFETALGLMGFDGKAHDLTKDLSNSNYRVPAIPVTLHGREKIYSPKNRSLWHKINGKTISENGQSGRLLSHRVNTVGKMRDIVRAGMSSFEIDIRYTAAGSETFFKVGHDEGSMSGMRLEEFLAEIPGSFEKIWLDVNNVKPENVNEIVSKLNELDAKYNIKHRTIVETGDRSVAPKLLVDEGYHVSYYLPTS
ncbi:MAG: phosphoethanolamine transferase, partial [Desulfobulbaceae bacterium]|nr:phosphoethanolamine transferase [Desulfobulbaceae bacterium]